MNEIIRESEEKQYGYELAIKNHIGGIFLWLLRYWHANGEEPLLEDFENQQLKQQLSPALTYMITNYEKSISAADMAKLCNLSYSYFSRSFNRLLHMNFSDYLNEIRIREAEKLLVSTTQNVTEIASAVGFCTTSYFIKQFTKYLHISPKQYQKQMRQDRKISLHNHATQAIIVGSVQWFLNGDWRCRTCHRLFCIRWYCNSKLYPIRKV